MERLNGETSGSKTINKQLRIFQEFKHSGRVVQNCLKQLGPLDLLANHHAIAPRRFRIVQRFIAAVNQLACSGAVFRINGDTN